MRQCPTCGKRYLSDRAETCDVDGAPLETVVVTSARDRLVGAIVRDRYEIDAVVGDGGMGVVYRAVDQQTGADCAIKVLRAEYTEEDDAVQRFQQEAEAVRRIKHPNVVEVYGFGALEDGSQYIVMEFLAGRSLSGLLRPPGARKKVPVGWMRALHIAEQIASALGYAHAMGVVHRDLKPDNVQLVEREGDEDFVKILDFGIAKVQGAEYARTRTGSVFGTPHYMAPEQAAGARDLDARTDIYALGCVLYELVAGRPPFESDNLMTVLTSHVYTLPDPPTKYAPPGALPEALEAVILKSLLKARESRYATMEAFREDLLCVARGERPRALDDPEVLATRRAALDGQTGTNPSGRLSQVPGSSASIDVSGALSGKNDVATRALHVGTGARTAAGSSQQSIPPVSAAPAGGARTGWIAAGFGVLALSSIAAGALLARSGDPRPGATATATVTAAASAPRATASVVPLMNNTALASALAMASAAGRASVNAEPTVLVDSVPTGAQVSRGNERLGVTPLRVPRPRAGEHVTYVLSSGRATVSLELDASSAPTRVLALQRNGAGGAAVTGPASASGPSASARPSARPQGARDLVDPWER